MRRQTGFGILWAILLLVVLSALGTAVLRFASTQNVTAANDAVGVQVYFAAVSGTEWGAAQVVSSATPPDVLECTGNWPFPDAVPGAPPDAVPGAPIWVKVECERTPANDIFCDGGEALVIYLITATACSPVADGTCPRTDATALLPGYVERQVVATVRWRKENYRDCITQ
ncbi:hypothetical protein JCM16106_11340 [Hydrogenophilus islandicus]